MRKIFKSQEGVTLVELLLYMGIFTILLVVLFGTFTSILDAELESQATSSVTQDGRYILSRLSYDIERAGPIALPATVGATGSALQLVATNSGTTVTYTYSLLNGNLQLATPSATDILNSYDTTVSNIVFKRLGDSSDIKNTINFSFTLTSKSSRTAAGPEVRSFQTTVGERQP